MLYISKIRIFFVSLISLFFILLTLSNFFKFDNTPVDKKINLGLDLQGGSYLLLEIDNNPVIEQKLQNLSLTIKNFFKEKGIRVSNFKITEKELFFSVNEKSKQEVLDIFEDENSDINPYYQRFKSHQLDISVENNLLKVNFSKQGIIELKLHHKTRH